MARRFLFFAWHNKSLPSLQPAWGSCNCIWWETATMRTSPEQLAFVVQFFIHSQECTERSPTKKTADCKGKKRSWLNDILGGGTQPVLHLKHNKEKPFSMYRKKCEEMGDKPIGRTLFNNVVISSNFLSFAIKLRLKLGFPPIFFTRHPHLSCLFAPIVIILMYFLYFRRSCDLRAVSSVTKF